MVGGGGRRIRFLLVGLLRVPNTTRSEAFRRYWLSLRQPDASVITRNSLKVAALDGVVPIVLLYGPSVVCLVPSSSLPKRQYDTSDSTAMICEGQLQVRSKRVSSYLSETLTTLGHVHQRSSGAKHGGHKT